MRLEDVHVEDVFASYFSRYASEPLGHARIINDAPDTIAPWSPGSPIRHRERGHHHTWRRDSEFCFTDVRDVVGALVRLADCDNAIGEVVNIGEMAALADDGGTAPDIV